MKFCFQSSITGRLTDRDFEAEEVQFAQVSPSQDELENIIFLPPLEQPLEEVGTVDKCRNNTNEKAIDSIKYEKLKQKIEYDKKVNESR